VIPLLADGQGDGQAIAARRERAGGIRRIRARRVFQTVEVEDEFTSLVETIRRIPCV